MSTQGFCLRYFERKLILIFLLLSRILFFIIKKKKIDGFIITPENYIDAISISSIIMVRTHYLLGSVRLVGHLP